MLKLFRNPQTAKLVRAIERDDADALARLLRKAAAGFLTQPLHNDRLASELAIDALRPRLLTLLLNAGADANATGQQGEPLTWLALVQHGPQGKSLPLLHALLRAGANPNSQNATGTPLLHACFACCEPTRLMLHLSRLLEAGADIDSSDERGDCLLLLALRNENRELIQFLIHSGATMPAPLPPDISADVALYAHKRQQDYQIRQQFLGA